jgi:hypothetical protein
MKKALLVAALVLFVLAGMMASAWRFLPSLAFRMLGRAVSGSVEASKTDVSYKDGLIVLTLNGVRLKGKVEGSIENCELRIEPAKGLYIRYLAVSGFDITVKRDKGGIRFIPLPVELAEIRRGLLDYQGKKYVVREIRVANFNTGKTLDFSIDGGVEGLGNLKTKGGSILNERRFDNVPDRLMKEPSEK